MDRDKAIQDYTPLVTRIASRMMKCQNSRFYDFDDLKQLGLIGLDKAAYSYHSGPVDFGFWSKLKIRGAILDGIRSLFRNRTDYQKFRLVEEVRAELLQELGREPTPEEMTEELKISAERYTDYRKFCGFLNPVSLDCPTYEGERPEAAEMIPDDSAPDPFLSTVDSEQRETVRTLVDKLSPRVREIIFLFYWQGLRKKDIAGKIGVSPTRVAQVIEETHILLRRRMKSLERSSPRLEGTAVCR